MMLRQAPTKELPKGAEAHYAYVQRHLTITPGACAWPTKPSAPPLSSPALSPFCLAAQCTRHAVTMDMESTLTSLPGRV
jgi:hypothetical protein